VPYLTAPAGSSHGRDFRFVANPAAVERLLLSARRSSACVAEHKSGQCRSATEASAREGALCRAGIKKLGQLCEPFRRVRAVVDLDRPVVILGKDVRLRLRQLLRQPAAVRNGDWSSPVLRTVANQGQIPVRKAWELQGSAFPALGKSGL